MALYNLPDNVDVKVWPDAGVTLVGQSYWTVDNVLATSRITGIITAQTAIATASILASDFGISGGDQTNLTLSLRRFNSADVLQNAVINTTFLNRDVDQVGLNVAMILGVANGDYVDLSVQQDGILAGLTNVDIAPTFQFWMLDFTL